MKNRYVNNRLEDGGHSHSRNWIVLPRCLLAGLIILAGLVPCRLSGQPTKPKAAPPSDRCLLVVETSKAMQRRTDAILRAVEDLLRSGLNGEFRDGGTLGVWTFNEDLSAGRFPLQTWSSSAQKDITRRILAFLKGQKYEKQANLDKVAPALARVVKDSELITVILISSGESQIRGTPFDDRINAAYRQSRDQQQKARMPFITILRARNGQFGAYVVNIPPWPLQVPQFAEDTKSAAQTHAKLIEALYSPPTSTVPPLIISGNRAVSKPEPAGATNAMPTSLEVASVTNKSTSVKPPESTKAEPVTVVAPITAPSSSSASQAKAESLAAPSKASEVLPIKQEPAPISTFAEPKARPTAVENTKPAAGPGPKVESAPAPSVTHQAQPAVPAQAVATQPAPSNMASVVAPPSSRPAPPAQTATATPAQSPWQSRNIWIAGTLLAVVGTVTVFVMIRRSRGAAQGSLITRSFERENKP